LHSDPVYRLTRVYSNS